MADRRGQPTCTTADGGFLMAKQGPSQREKRWMMAFLAAVVAAFVAMYLFS